MPYAPPAKRGPAKRPPKVRYHGKRVRITKCHWPDKSKYPSEITALIARRRMAEQGKDVTGLHPYACPGKKKHWHLGHRNRWFARWLQQHAA